MADVDLTKIEYIPEPVKVDLESVHTELIDHISTLTSVFIEIVATLEKTRQAIEMLNTLVDDKESDEQSGRERDKECNEQPS